MYQTYHMLNIVHPVIQFLLKPNIWQCRLRGSWGRWSLGGAWLYYDFQGIFFKKHFFRDVELMYLYTVYSNNSNILSQSQYITLTSPLHLLTMKFMILNDLWLSNRPKNMTWIIVIVSYINIYPKELSNYKFQLFNTLFW